MSPLEINALLRLWSHAYPLEDMPQRQAMAPAMCCAYQRFEQEGLLMEGVSHATVLSGLVSQPFLSEKGIDLVDRLCKVEP